MRTISIGLFTEGPTDVDFYSPLVVRLGVALIRSGPAHPTQFADPISLPGRPASATFADAIERYAASCDLVIVHTDGGGDPDRARRERIEPWFRSVSPRPLPVKLVDLVPVHETEAWMLCDEKALNAVLGSNKTRRDFGLPARRRDVERIADPKDKLRAVQRLVWGERRARRLGTRPLYAALGQEVSLEPLSDVPAFVLFKERLTQELRALGCLRGR